MSKISGSANVSITRPQSKSSTSGPISINAGQLTNLNKSTTGSANNDKSNKPSS